MKPIKLPVPSTSLSPHVHHIITHLGCLATESDGEALTEDGLFSWTHLQHVMPAGEETSDYFMRCAASLSVVFRCVDEELSSWTLERFNRYYGPYIQWTSQPQVVEECFHMCSQGDTPVIHSLLLSTSILERSLGNVLVGQGQQCPSMLKDLLLTPELAAVFGPTAIQLLRALIGPPISLNLRNVTWHGFPAPAEIHKQYAFMMICIIASLGSVLVKQQLVGSVKPRPHFEFTHQMEQLQHIFPEVAIEDVDDLLKVFHQSDFVLTSVYPLWERALHMFSKASYGDCICLLLPQLEHGIRRVFSVVNNCPERVLTAESTVLFTTFDEMLDRYLPDNQENKLRDILSDNVMSLLLDILTYPEGPRVRDHMSHGEMDIPAFSAPLANHILCICAALCLIFTDSTSALHSEVAMLKCIHQAFQAYTSIFHPVKQLQTQILQLWQSLSSFSTLHLGEEENDITQIISGDEGASTGVDDAGLAPSISAAAEPSKVMPATTGNGQVSQVAYHLLSVLHVDHSSLARLIETPEGWQQLESVIRTHQVATLYRGHEQPLLAASGDIQNKNTKSTQESELINLLRRILEVALAVSTQVHTGVNSWHTRWKKKELRSRQRETFRRIQQSVPVVYGGLQLVLVCVACHYLSLKDEPDTSTPLYSKHMIKYLRFMLQYVENLRTYTSPEKNLWENAVSFTQQLHDRTMKLK